MSVLNLLSNTARDNLRGQLHKVAAVMARQDGTPIARDEVTIKEAAYLVGVRFWKNYLEKRAMFDGILNVMRLRGTR